MKIKKISNHNLPDKEVLAFNGGDFLVGYLGKEYDGTIKCEATGPELHNCTHYILIEDLQKLFKQQL